MESDEVNSYNGSSSCCSSRIPALSYSCETNTPNHSSDNAHRFNSDHVKVIPSLRTTIPSGYKYLQVQTLTKETITLAVHVSLVLKSYSVGTVRSSSRFELKWPD